MNTYDTSTPTNLLSALSTSILGQTVVDHVHHSTVNNVTADFLDDTHRRTFIRELKDGAKHGKFICFTIARDIIVSWYVYNENT